MTILMTLQMYLEEENSYYYMNITIRTLETFEGESNKLTLSDDDMGESGCVNMSTPVQDKTGKEVGRIDMIVNVSEIKSALMLFNSHPGDNGQELTYAMKRVIDHLDNIMTSNPKRDVADASNLLVSMLEKGL